MRSLQRGGEQATAKSDATSLQQQPRARTPEDAAPEHDEPSRSSGASHAVPAPGSPPPPADAAKAGGPAGHHLGRIALFPSASPSQLEVPLLQPKLSVSTPDSLGEREAERVADTVVRMADAAPAPLPITPVSSSELQREVAEPESVEEEEEELISIVSSQEAGAGEPPPEDEDTRLLQPRRDAHHAPSLSPELVSRLGTLEGTGQPLPAPVRDWFEPRFGHDFSRVRIHTDASAAAMARGLRAEAFTVGRDIVFESGRYAPHSPAGRHLLAHELTHVLQQGAHAGGPVRRAVQRQPAPKQTATPTKPTYSFHVAINRSMAAPELLVHVVSTIFGVGPGQAQVYIRDYGLHWVDRNFQGTSAESVKKGTFGFTFPQDIYDAIRGRARQESGGTESPAPGKGKHPFGSKEIYESLTPEQKRAVNEATNRWFWSVSGREKGSALGTGPEDETWRKLWSSKRADYIEDLLRYEDLPQDIKDVLQVLMQGEGPPRVEDLQKALELAEQLVGLTPEKLEELKTAGGKGPIKLSPGAKWGGESGLKIAPFEPKARLVLTPEVDTYVQGSEVGMEVYFEGSTSDNRLLNVFSNRAHFDWTVLHDGKVVDSGPLLEGWGSRQYDTDLDEKGTYVIQVTVTSPFFLRSPEQEQKNENAGFQCEKKLVVMPEAERATQLFNAAFVGEAAAGKPFFREGAELRAHPSAKALPIEKEIERLRGQLIILEEMAKAPDPKYRLTESELKAYREGIEKRIEALTERQADTAGLTPYVARGIYVSRETSANTQLTVSMFGGQKGTTYRVVLYDSTLNKVVTHEGESTILGTGTQEDVARAEERAIDALLAHWKEYNDYPKGMLHVGIRPVRPGNFIERQIDTHNTRKTVEAGLSYAAAGAGVVLLAASFFTGGTTAPVGIVLLQGVAVGASAGVFLLKLEKRMATDTLAADQELTMDLLDLVSGVLGGVGSFGKALSGSSKLVRGMYFATMTGLDVGSGILLTTSTRDQIIQAEAQHKVALGELEKEDLEPAERERRRKKLEDAHAELLAKLLAAAAFSGGLLIVSAAGSGAHLGTTLRERPMAPKVKELAHRGSPEEIQKYLDTTPDIPPEQRQLLELIAEGHPAGGGKATFVPEVEPPKGTALQRVADTDPLVKALPSSLRGKVPVYVDPHVDGVRIHYTLTDGVVTHIEVHMGAKSGRPPPARLTEHLPALQMMLGYSGLLGRLKRMLRQLASKATGGKVSATLDPARLEAKAELEKLPQLIEGRLMALRDGAMSAEDAADDILFLKQQMDHYEGALERGEAVAKGFVAAYSPPRKTAAWDRMYGKLASSREKDVLPEGWTGEMEAKFRGYGEAQPGYRWVFDKDTKTLRYERMSEGIPRRSWSTEEKKFTDITNIEEARFLPPEAAPPKVDTDLAKFEAANPSFGLKKKVEAALPEPIAVTTLDDLAALRAKKSAELDPLRTRADQMKDQQKLLEARKKDLEALITERKQQVAELEKAAAEAKKATPAAPSPEAKAPTEAKPAGEKPPETAATPAEPKAPVEDKAAALEKQRAEAQAGVQKLEADKAAVEAQQKKLAEQQETLAEQTRPLYAAVTKVSEQLAEATSVMYVKQKYPKAELRYGGPGSPTQSGVFDQVWFVKDGRGPGKDLWLVVEAKGGVSDLGSRQVGGKIAEQGSPTYFHDVVRAMSESSNPEAVKAAESLDLAEAEAITYLLIQAPYKFEGGTLKAGEPRVKTFDLSPREPSP